MNVSMPGEAKSGRGPRRTRNVHERSSAIPGPKQNKSLCSSLSQCSPTFSQLSLPEVNLCFRRLAVPFLRGTPATISLPQSVSHDPPPAPPRESGKNRGGGDRRKVSIVGGTFALFFSIRRCPLSPVLFIVCPASLFPLSRVERAWIGPRGGPLRQPLCRWSLLGSSIVLFKGPSSSSILLLLFVCWHAFSPWSQPSNNSLPSSPLLPPIAAHTHTHSLSLSSLFLSPAPPPPTPDVAPSPNSHSPAYQPRPLSP